MDMKKIAFVVLVAAICMTAVMGAGKEQPKPTFPGGKGPSKSGAPTPAPARGPAGPTKASSPEGPIGSAGSTSEASATPAPAPEASSANVVVGSFVGASFVSFLALYM